MLPRLASTALAVLLWVGSPALARPLDCPELYNQQLQDTLDEVDQAFGATELTRARALLAASHERLPCLIEIVPVDLMTRYAVQRAYGEALVTETEEATRWARLAQALDPGFDWPEYIPDKHEARRLLDGLEPPTGTSLRGKGLRPDPGGGIFLDGRYLVSPVAEAGLPHFLQVGDGAGEIWLASWQDGVVFPEEVLGPPTAINDQPPPWFGKPPGSVVAPRPIRARRLETSLGFAAAAGTLFGSAWIARDAYVERPTDTLQLTVNGTTAASVAASGAALGFLGVALFTKR